ncbi:TPA: CDP-2,3-bis-(O-geranylgeranyl)-sn-glycerol synthase [Candidatus Bathyarchaeota archaeon]|nr:CDP-2,3-bis-(O-geranylgeranyl)-sn-glycerol synthase [Candidatus Bathyarchaeota archaeon]
MQDIPLLLGDALLLFFPAYVANAVPVLLGGGTPIDLGRGFIDGRPIFGRNKTVRGFLSGIAVGSLAGTALFACLPAWPAQRAALRALLLSLGAMIGDLCGSFVKRRLGRSPGSPLFPLDQLGFVIGATALLAPVYLPPIETIGTILVVTPPIHMATNKLACLLGVRSRSSPRACTGR